MKPRRDEHLEQMRREHARWSAEHGHWEKNIRAWHGEHVDALDVIAKIQALTRRFDEKVPMHRREIALHEEETRLHARELDGAAPGSKHPGEELHRCGIAEHAREREAQEELRCLHEQVIAEVDRLRAVFPTGITSVPVGARDEVERLPEI